MKPYEPVTLTHMQAYLLQFILEKTPSAQGGLGSSTSLTRLYRDIAGTPPPTAADLEPRDEAP